jgi:putative ABC transport system permease protein
MPLDLTPAPGGRRSSFRVALRMARRDIRRHRGRSFLIVLLIMLPVAGMTGAATLYQSSQRTPEEIVRYELGNAQARFSALASVNAESIQDPLNDVVVASSTGNADPDFIATPPEELLPEGYDVLPMRQLQLTTTVGEALVSLNGVQVDALNPAFTGKFTLLDGRAPESSQEVLVSRGLLERFHLQLGEEFTTSAGIFVPVGTLRDADASDNNSFLYVQPGQVAPAVLGRERELPQSVSYYLAGPEPVSWQQVRAANRQGVAVLSRSVVLDPPPLDQRVVSGAQPRYESTEALTLYASFGLLGALALLEVGLLAGAAFAVGAKRQVRELALLAASGAETPTVRAVVTAAGLWLGAIAVMAGAGLGLGAAAVVVLWVRSTGSARLAGLHPDILLTSVAMLMGLAACILAAVAPAGQVARQAVLGALKSGRAPAGNGKRTSITGAVLLVAAVGLLAAGWLLGQSAKDPDRQAEQLPLVATLLIGGAVLAVAALVLLTGWLIVRLTSRTQWLSLPLRMAARDSARNRGRTVPAVAAVLAAATLASAGLVLSATQQTWMRDNHSWSALENQTFLPLSLDQPLSADGSTQPPVEVDPAELSAAVERAIGTVAWTQVITAPAYPRNCGDGPLPSPETPARTATSNCLQYSLARPEGNECAMTPQRRIKDPADWRCQGALAQWSGSHRAVVVGGADEIRAVLGREAGPEALAVLDAGGMVVTNPVFVRDGTTVLLGQDVRTWNESASDPSLTHDTVSSSALPAVVVEPAEAVPYYGVISPETAERLDLRAEPAELLVQLDRRPSAAEADAAAAAVAAVYKQPGAGFWAEPGVSQDNQWMFWLIVAASAVITLSAAGITTGLALADARNDHVTLAGVGASPRLRKGLAAAQALLTSGLGAALGTIAGAVPAVLIVASTDMRTAVEIPWLHLLALVLAVPLTGSALAWICTRAVLPMSRRGLVG